MLNKQYKLKANQSTDSLGLADGLGNLELYSIESSIKNGCCNIDGAELGEIVFVPTEGISRTVFFPKSNDNTLFITDQCNNRCLMCSQPPSTKDDSAFYYKFNHLLINLMSAKTSSIGITGGEPTIIGLRLCELIQSIYYKNKEFSVHLLSNGRRFEDKRYTELFAEFSERDFMIGVPIHSDYSCDHDKIAGVIGAYNQTLLGLYNLALYDIDTEIRIVINRLNYKRLAKLSQYIFKNMPFVRHIAFMGLENTGLAVKNRDQICISPVDYTEYLEEAVIELAGWNMNVSIYNIPLCQLKPTLFQFAKRSISDWKQSYTALCADCLLRYECCGVFSTSKHIDITTIKPIKD